MRMSAVNHFHSLIIEFFLNGRNINWTLYNNPFSILFSSRSVITVRILDKLSNRLEVTLCSLSFTLFSVLINGLSNLEITNTLSNPMAIAIDPNKGEKKMMAPTEKTNFVRVYK